MALDIRSQLTHKETNKKIRILWLSEDDMVEAGVLDAGRAVDVMEEVVGLLEDGAWGYECYKNAKENLIGRPLKLWDSPITF